MAKYVQVGANIDYVNSTENKIAAGDVVSLGTCVGVAACDIPVGAVGALATEGVFEFDKTTSLEIAIGDNCYFNASSKKITKTATDIPVGIAVEAGASSATAIRVKLVKIAAGQAANVAEAASTAPTAAEFKALLDALIAAGIMAPAAE